jgi:hypothetical protein
LEGGMGLGECVREGGGGKTDDEESVWCVRRGGGYVMASRSAEKTSILVLKRLELLYCGKSHKNKLWAPKGANLLG